MNRLHQSSIRSVIQLLTAATLAGGLLVGTAAAAQATPTLPSQDSFYSYNDSLASVAPGTVLRSRTVTVAWVGLPTPVTATQLLYRTTTQLGTPTVTVTTVLRTADVNPLTRIVSYQMFYDGLGPECDPSYNLQEAALTEPSAISTLKAAGVPESGNDSQVEEALMTPYLAAGDTLVVSDYEGEDYAWGAGQQSGYETLDGIRAAERFLRVSPRHTPVALLGYSGGSIATAWATEVAPAYAPDLDVVGAAAGGVPVDFAGELQYLDGSSSWAGVMPGVLVGVARGFNVDLTPYLSPYGQRLAQAVSGECANSFEGAYDGLTIKQLAAPQDQNLVANPLIASVINQLIMGSDGTPRAPLLLGVGNADGTGDGVMVADDVEALAHLYCQRGVSVEFDEFQKLDHLEAAVPFEAHTFALIHAWLTGLPTPNGCGSIGAGDSLAPLPTGIAPPPPPASAISSGDVTSVEPAGSANAFDGDATLALTGIGSATVSQFAADHDPAGPATFDSTGRYLNVAVAPGSSFSRTVLSVCGVGTARHLEWWDASAGSGAGEWKPTRPAAKITANPLTAGPSPCLTVNLSDRPSLGAGQGGSITVGLGR
jgi:hypothetical protein